MVNRAVLAHRLFTGVSRRHLACLIEELAVPWQAGVEGRRHAARGGSRKRAEGAGARHQLVFVDRLVATLIHLRHDLPHAVLGLLFGVNRSTITRAVGEIRTLPAERGCAVPNRPDLRLRTLADVFAYAWAEGIELRLDATEIQVRRPKGGCVLHSGTAVDGVEPGLSWLHSVVRASLSHWNCAKNLQISALVQVATPLSPEEPSTGPGM